MSLTIQQGIPATLTQGDAVSFKVSNPDFPAPGWDAQVIFKIGMDTPIVFTASDLGLDHLFALTNAQTGTLKPGNNLVSFAYSDGTNRQSSDWQEVIVLSDPTQATEPSFAQKQVTLLQTVIASFNNTTHKEVNFNGQSFMRADVGDYQKQLTYWEARLVAEQVKEDSQHGISRGGRIPVQFV